MIIGQNINEYFSTAMAYPVERLEAVIRGQDKSIPAAAAMMALPLKQRAVAAAVGMQTAQQPQPNNLRQRMVQATTPQMPQGMPQGAPQAPQGNPQQVAALPENTGVMNLPAPNMEKMAGGGIIAFDDGGEVPSYAGSPGWGSLVGGGSMLPPQSVENQNVFAQMAAGDADRQAQENAFIQNIIDKQARGEPLTNAEQALVSRSASAQKAIADTKTKAVAAVTPPATNFSDPAYAKDMQGFYANTAALSQPEFKDATQKAKQEKAPPVAEKKKEPGIGGIPKAGGTGVGSGSYEDYLKKVSAGDKDMLGQYEKLGKEETTGMEALLAEREKNKPGGKAGESLEKYLKGKESADVNKRAENINNAFVNAGFAMATGDSPSILQNLAKGGKEGMASYKAGLEKLDAAADERAKMFASIEDARRAEAKGDWKELYAARADIKKHEFATKKYGIDALVKLTGENRKVAADMANTASTNARILQATGITAAASRENAAATREATGAYRQGQLRQDALALGQKMLDEKMKQFQLEKLTMTPEVYEQWRAHYNKLAFNQMGIPQPGTATASNDVFKVLGPET